MLPRYLTEESYHQKTVKLWASELGLQLRKKPRQNLQALQQLIQGAVTRAYLAGYEAGRASQ